MHIIKDNPHLFVILFFSLLFLVGIFVVTDYGVSWDEAHSHEVGMLNWDYAVKGDTEILFSPLHQNYGPAFALPLIFVEKLLKINSQQSIFYFQHLATFLLFFAGVFVFFRLCYARFKNEWLALLGAFFLVVSPRIFGESFYNPKDIPLLSLFIFSIFTLVRFLEKPSFSRALAHAVASAIAIDTRLQGIAILGFTFLFSVGDLCLFPGALEEWKRRLGNLFLYFLLCGSFIVLFWPLLWENPLYYFLHAVKETSRYTYEGGLPLLYLGTFIRADSLPWHYIPLWILITTPIIYMFYFLLGIGRIVRELCCGFKKFYLHRRLDLLFCAWFFLPIAGVIAIQSVLYDGWRLLYFIYPSIILIGLIGLEWIFHFFANQSKETVRTTGVYLLCAVTVINLSFVLYFMIKNHPYEHLYFNALVGNMENARSNFDMDYWGLTFREGLEYIARTDSSKEIPIVFLYDNESPLFILSEHDRVRFKVVQDPHNAKYILNNYRFQQYDLLPWDKEIYAVTVGGAKVMSVFKRQ